MKKHLQFIAIITALSACASPGSPKEVFDKYIEQEKSGFTSFEVFLDYYSERKTKEIQASITQIIKQHPEKKEDQIKTSTLGHFLKSGKCKEYTFKNVKINKSKATLVYSVNNICEKIPFVNTELIYMLNESGWKIDEVDIKL